MNGVRFLNLLFSPPRPECLMGHINRNFSFSCNLLPVNGNPQNQIIQIPIQSLSILFEDDRGDIYFCHPHGISHL
jgi:hypothetical protein